MSYAAEQWVQRQKDLHRTPSAVLANLAGRAKHRSLECWPSQQTIAEDLRMSRRTIGKALEYLEEQGFIERERQHRKGTGYRAQDRITLRMESKQTVVQIAETYSEYTARKQPGLYTYKDPDEGLCERLAPPMRKPFPALNRKIEREEVPATRAMSSRDSVSREISPRARAMSIEAEWVDEEWSIRVLGPIEHEDNQPFRDTMARVIETGLDAALTAGDLTIAFQESWDVGDHWVVQVEHFAERVAALMGRRADLRTLFAGVGS